MNHNALPLTAALVAAVAIAGIVALEVRAGSSHGAQTRLSAAAAGLNELQMVPFRAELGGTSTGGTDAHMLALEEPILATATDVGGAQLVALLQRNFAVLEGIRAQAPAGRAARLAAAERSRLAAAEALARRSAAYGRQGHRALVTAVAGSIVVIVALLGALWLYYLRSASVRRREQLASADLDVARDERKRLLARALEAAQDERTRIAADLHDGPIQRLTAAAFTIDLLGRKLARGERELDGLVAQIREQLSGEMESLRRMMSGLRPPLLDQGDVTAAIRDCADSLLDPKTTHKVRDTIGNTFVSRDLEAVAFHVAREAIVNVKRHARASHVAITLSAPGDNLQLTIVDDGAGFVPETTGTARLEHHLGLTAMRERVESVGGELQVISEPGAGTRIDAILPLPQPASGRSAERRTHAGVA
jgi:signal transduction histidine kinase